MDSRCTALGLRHRLVALLQSADNTINSRHKVLALNCLLVLTRCDECRLVTDVSNICSRESRCLASQELAIDIVVQLDVAHVYCEDLLTLVHVWQTDINLTVETSSTHQCLIQNVGTVCCCQDYHSSVGLETIHLGEHLVECILTLVVTRESCVLTSCTTYGVDLVDEDDTWRLLLGLLEEVSYSRSTHSDKHLNEVRSRDRKEWHICLARYGLRQQRLTSSWRAYKQSTLRDLCSQLLIFLRVLEEIYDLHNLGLSLRQSCYILKRNTLVWIIFVELLSASLANIHDATTSSATSARHSANEQEPYSDQEEPRQEVDDHLAPTALLVVVLYADRVVLQARISHSLLYVTIQNIYRADRKGKLLTMLGDVLKSVALLGVVVALDSLVCKIYLGVILVDYLDSLNLTLVD